MLICWDKPYSNGKLLVSTADKGKAGTVELPPYTAPESPAMWKPLFEGLKSRLAKYGLDKKIILGIVPDGPPSTGVIQFYASILPKAKWMRHAHSMRRNVNGGPLGYQCLVWTPRFPECPDCRPHQGWKRKDLIAQFIRSRDMFPLVHFRLMAEMNIAGTQRGIGRVGLDFWPVLKGKRNRMYSIQGRYPSTGWRNLDWMLRAFAHPGPDGAMATCRSEMMREGLQECEARVLIEKALDGGKLAGSIKRRCTQFIQDRTYMVRVALDNQFTDGFAKDAGHSWWSTPGQLGYHRHIGAGVWQRNSEELYALASEVVAATGAISAAEAKVPASTASAPAATAARRPVPRSEGARPASGGRSPASDEVKAGRLWRAANNFIRNNMPALAKRKLDEIVKKYPATEFARKAKEKLGELGGD